MGGHDLRFGMVAVFVKIFSKPQRPGLVHAQMYPLRQEWFRRPTDTGLHKAVNLALANHQDIIRILHARHGFPAQRILQMRKRLDAGNHLNAELIRVYRKLMQLFAAVTAPVSAKIRIFLHLIGILRIQHHRVHAERRLKTDVPFNHIHGEYTVSGAVQHDAVSVQPDLFLHLKAFFTSPLFQLPHQPHQRTEDEGLIAGGKHGAPVCAGYGNLLFLCQLDAEVNDRPFSCILLLSGHTQRVSPLLQQLPRRFFVPLRYIFQSENHVMIPPVPLLFYILIRESASSLFPGSFFAAEMSFFVSFSLASGIAFPAG